MTDSAPLPCLCLAGPTASGKSAAALALARAAARTQPIEIVSVDSALVYRDLDIGTAKPTTAERAEVPHHLIDIRDPTEPYSAADFVRDATAAIAEIRARGHAPVLVGGTMLYFKALFDGIDDMPASNPAMRATLEAEAREHGWPAMHAKLAEVDPATARRLSPNDSQRVQRALEVFRLSGQPLSAHHTGRRVRPPPPLISLEPGTRAWLHERIAQRFDAMLDQGFVDEVRRLRRRGDLHPQLPAMRCVGYRQAWAALDAEDLAPLREQGIAATRQLAKRQMTWLRSMPHREVVVCDTSDAIERVIQRATPHLKRLSAR